MIYEKINALKEKDKSSMVIDDLIINYEKLFKYKNCEWLFAVTLINITQICYHLLRDDLLDQFSNKSDEKVDIEFILL